MCTRGTERAAYHRTGQPADGTWPRQCLSGEFFQDIIPSPLDSVIYGDVIIVCENLFGLLEHSRGIWQSSVILRTVPDSPPFLLTGRPSSHHEDKTRRG